MAILEFGLDSVCTRGETIPTSPIRDKCKDKDGDGDKDKEKTKTETKTNLDWIVL